MLKYGFLKETNDAVLDIFREENGFPKKNELTEGWGNEGYDFEGDDIGVKAWSVTPTFWELDLYDNLKQIGKRGKRIKHLYKRVIHKEGRTAWPETLIARLKPNMGKAEVMKEFDKIIKEMERDTEAEVQVSGGESELKAVDRSIIEPSWANKFIDKAGKDISVHFKKPHVTISSKKDSKAADEQRMYHYIDVDWHYAKKVNMLVDELIKGVGLSSAGKILKREKIKYKEPFRMDPMWESKQLRLSEGSIKISPDDPVKKLWVVLKSELTQFDKKQSTKSGYNHYALAQYLEAVNKAAKLVGSKDDKILIFKALIKSFTFNRNRMKFDLPPLQRVAKKYGVDYESVSALHNKQESSDIVVKDGKKFFKPKKPVYHRMPVEKFSDMTERELNKLVHKAIKGVDVHFGFSDLFTDKQLNALLDSEVFNDFSRSTKDDIYNALGESVEISESNKLKDVTKKTIAMLSDLRHIDDENLVSDFPTTLLMVLHNLAVMSQDLGMDDVKRDILSLKKRLNSSVVKYQMGEAVGKNLIGSAPSLERIQKLISKYFMGSKVDLKETGENEWSVATGKGVIPKLRVIKKKNRFRFERTESKYDQITERDTTPDEWKKALDGNRRVLKSLTDKVKRMRKGETFPNLTMDGAMGAIRGLTVAIKNIEKSLGENVDSIVNESSYDVAADSIARSAALNPKAVLKLIERQGWDGDKLAELIHAKKVDAMDVMVALVGNKKGMAQAIKKIEKSLGVS